MVAAWVVAAQWEASWLPRKGQRSPWVLGAPASSHQVGERDQKTQVRDGGHRQVGNLWTPLRRGAGGRPHPSLLLPQKGSQ